MIFGRAAGLRRYDDRPRAVGLPAGPSKIAGRCWSAALCVLALTVSAAAFAADSTLENGVKATYIYKLAPFVEWPASAFVAEGSPLTICVVGNDPVSALIDQAAAGQRVDDRPITVRHLAAVAPNSGCHILYAAGTEEQKANALTAVKGAPVLTVTDAANSGAAKGIIAFVIQDNRVRFEIDDASASRAGLVISSKLLSLAVSVKPRN